MEAAGHAAAGPGPDAAEALTASFRPARAAPFPGSIALSTLVHGVALVLLVRLAAPPLPPLARVIPVSLVSLPGGGGGPAGPDVGPPPGPPPAPLVVAPAPPPARVAAVPKPAPRVTRPAPQAAATESAPASPDVSGNAAVASAGSASGAGGSGSGGGDGSGGDGSGGARAYGQNPLPPYPFAWRRMGMQGDVLLEVLVASDGSVALVRLARSSGYSQLDDSAVRTVRERWRFIPARRDGTAVESRGTFLIRFRLEGVETAG